MSHLFPVVLQFLDQDDWKYKIVEGKTMVKFGIAGDSANFDCYIDVREDKQIFLFYILAPNRAPQHKRLDVAEFITRANYGLWIGNFELDMDDGEVRYRSAIDVEGGELTPLMVKNAIYSAISTMNDYYPGLMSVIFSDTSSEDAIAAVESSLLEPPANIIESLEAALDASEPPDE